jgi:hypothetical protein
LTRRFNPGISKNIIGVRRVIEMFVGEIGSGYDLSGVIEPESGGEIAR